MSKLGKALFLILTLSVLVGCTKSFSIENPVKVTVQSGPNMIEVTDEETIRALTEDITSKEFKRGKSSTKTSWTDDQTYWLKWYNGNDEVIFEVCAVPGAIVYGEHFWQCENGTVDTDYYDELLEAAK